MKRASPLLLIMAGCDPGCTAGDVEHFEWAGENVTVVGHGYSEADACAESLTALDERIAMVMDFLGIDSAPRFEFWWASEDAWEQRPLCEAPAYACARGHHAYSRRLPDMHEATHLVTYARIEDDECPPILTEGLAEYLEDPRFLRLTPSLDYGVVDLIEDHHLPKKQGVYTRAMHFVSYLVETYGPEEVVSLCSALPRDDSLSDWEATVPDVLNTSFGALLDDYETLYPLCTSDQLRARLWGCAGAPDLVLVGEDSRPRKYVLEAGCEGSRTTNAASADEGGAATTHLVHVPRDAWLTLSARATGRSGTPARFTIQQCASCYDDPITIHSGDSGWHDSEDTYLVNAGTYEVTLFFNPSDHAELEIIVGSPL